MAGQKSHLYTIIGKSEKETSFLFTGADMDNLSIQQMKYKAMAVYALVTAGVRSNAMRMSKDEGLYYEPGTINIIIMSNMKLSPRAMTRAIISATEGKTAALLDMDIRSSYGKGRYRATGTGTDNILVVEGTGTTALDHTGGHTKLGELIARAVYAGVQDAVYMQNGFTVSRNVFQRLKERDITIYGLIANEKCDCGRDKSEFVRMVDEILLDARYEGFIEFALAFSDDYDKGLVEDLTLFETCCRMVAEEIAGIGIEEMNDIVIREDVPIVLKMALNAIFNGVYYSDK